MVLWVCLLACDAKSGVADTADTASPSDTAVAVAYDATYDVIVVGSGPAGSAAVIEAAEAGASVVLFERSASPGLGVRTAGQAYAMGTPWQEEQGIFDTLESAQEDWTIATGADGYAESVTAYIGGSAATLVWLSEHGAEVLAPNRQGGEGTVARIHELAWPSERSPFETLLSGTNYELRLGVEVTAPVLEDGAVVGVWWRDAVSGRTGATAAKGGVVVATGGFLRNLDAVEAVRPDLVALDPVFETLPTSNGGGLPLFSEVGAGSYLPENIGSYVHSVEDPRYPEREAMILVSFQPYILVGEDGQRFTRGDGLGSFDVVNDLPEGGGWFVAGVRGADSVLFSPPAYNWESTEEPEYFNFGEVVAMGSDALVSDPDLAVAAAVAGVDGAVVDVVEQYNALAATSQTDEFGQQLHPEDQLAGTDWVFGHFRPGLAKNFGGVLTDGSGRVLTPAGEPIPGLWAAGECLGMVPGGGSGKGFTGSASALYYGGRLAGAGAAARRSSSP
jgi:succinate dehydrogenase/fumarate reductase flavoprotein subunit